MKKYHDYVTELESDELYNGLLGYGLFAEKIPNFLTSKSFLEYFDTLERKPKQEAKEYVRYLNMRSINIPRPLAIPDPFAYGFQIQCLKKHWDKIKEYFIEKTSDHTYKISRIHIRKMLETNHLFEMNYKNFEKDGAPEQDIIIPSKFIAKADISNCFGSIYSHSIPWALVGKKKAKMTSTEKSKWYNELDFFTRNMKHGETNGILIGPHSSNLISELVLVNIDSELCDKYKFIRNIDDYTCYVDSYEKAESFFIDLSEELKKFELSLNSKKSQILPLPQASVKHWVTRLNHFNFYDTYVISGETYLKTKELKGFMDFSVELMLQENSDASILNYAIQIVADKSLGYNATNYYKKQIHHLVLLYPYLVTFLEEYVFEPHDFDNDIICEIATSIFELGHSKKNYEACAYAIFWALKYDFTLPINELKEKSLESLDCIFMLLAFLYDKKNNSKTYLKEYRDKAKELKSEDFDRFWLYLYEVLSQSDLAGYYSNMKSCGISFIKDAYKP